MEKVFKMKPQNIRVFKENDVRISTTVNDNFSLPVDLSSAQEIEWIVKLSADTATIISKTKTGGDFVFPSANQLYFDVTDTETNIQASSYIHELKITTAAGLKYTVFQGRLIIQNSII